MMNPTSIRLAYIAVFFKQLISIFLISLLVLSSIIFGACSSFIPESISTISIFLAIVAASCLISFSVANKLQISDLFPVIIPLAYILFLVKDIKIFSFEANHQGNPAGVFICLLILAFCRLCFLAFHGQLNLSINKKKKEKNAYEKFYSENFNSLKVLAWMLVGSRIFNSVAGFKFKGGLTGGGGASGSW